MSPEQRLINPSDDDYPQGLLDLEEPPQIYVTGPLPSGPAIAVVGTRRCTRYGLDLAVAFGAALSRNGWAVVSGMARGIDAASHRGALEAGGKAIGVLGTGLDIWYPAENKALYRSLLDEGGCLLSEYPAGTGPDRWRFPARNRLIAAVASATVVVEAGETGGALITARLAAEMGRPLFVVPGDVDRPASMGCNRLIRDGAHPVLGAEDLVVELSIALGIPVADPARSAMLPAEGILIEDLPRLWDCSFSEALTRVGQLETEGLVRNDGEVVVPRHRPSR